MKPSKTADSIVMKNYVATFNKGCRDWILVLPLLFLLLLPVGVSAETLTDRLPIGKLVDAPEIEAVLTPSRKGRLFTLNHVPQFTGNIHPFTFPNSTTAAQLDINSKNAELKVGSAYVVTDVKQMAKMRSGEKIVTTSIELSRLKGSIVSEIDDDVVIYDASFVVTGREVYDEELFLTVMGRYFDSVAQSLRNGWDYAGNAELEGTPETIRVMINLIGLDWMIGGKNYKGLIQKEKAKNGAVADFYVLKFESPIPAKNGEKLVPAFDRSDMGNPFHNFSPIVIDSKSVTVGGVFHHFEVRVVNPK